ncbi:TenA family transcriptional regulator [Mastigocoleus sp. MO_188.B34]|uniref:TenA family transcriptional regulator n=1 Tax=Mastigocoleus sp. MO_188.B34 TaxID=3036635 RepID=UPI0026255227|nr:TenA family transcriptional regulator [Mastigocoleus sp. MO_188.B34]MDJ0695705.1 TenA family transcriptional regulator [Mastigocoleus sp. MO_188.B34]
MSISCSQLLGKHSQAWKQATVHPFLTQCQLGTIQPQQFSTWLVQDYLFVVEFTRFVARVLANAPSHHFDILLSGLGALKDELNWFQAKAQERQLNLKTEPQETCKQYCEYMKLVTTMPYAVQTTTLWAIELAYNQGWQLPGKMPLPYAEFAERWGNQGFTEYVKLLEQIADEVLSTVDETIQSQAESAFLEIAVLEKDFWSMAMKVI